MLPGKCKLKQSDTTTHLLAKIQIISKQVSKLYSMLEDDKYHGEKLSCKGDREYQVGWLRKTPWRIWAKS